MQTPANVRYVYKRGIVEGYFMDVRLESRSQTLKAVVIPSRFITCMTITLISYPPLENWKLESRPVPSKERSLQDEPDKKINIDLKYQYQDD